MDLLPQFGAVLTVFAVLGATLWWLRRRGLVQWRAQAGFRLPMRSRQEKVLEQIDVLALSPTHSLNLIRMADRAILVGISPTGFYLVESQSWKSLEPHATPEAKA